jgi:hypothetical protein
MPEAAAELDALADELYPVWFRYRPDLALRAGVPGYGRLLPPGDEDDLGALRGWLESVAIALDELDFGALDPARRLDWELIDGCVRMEHGELGAPDRRCRESLGLTAVEEIYRLTLEPTEEIGTQLAPLLAAVPAHLRQVQARLGSAVEGLAPELLRAAAREAEAGRCFVRELIRGDWLKRRCPGAGELEPLAESACESLSDLGRVLDGKLAPRGRGPAGCGSGHLRLRLARLHFMDWDPSECVRPLEEALVRTEEAIDGLAGPADPGGNLALERIAAHRVGGETRLRLHAELGIELALEIRALGPLDLPPAALHTGTRPACPRPNRYRADYLADGEGFGTLYLTVRSVGDDSEPVESVRERCLAKGWGGLHLLAFANPALAQRLPRRLAHPDSLVQGLALYLGRRLADASGDSDRQIWVLDSCRRALTRAQVDLDLHAGRIDWEGALARLAEIAPAADAGRARDWAELELTRIGLSPGDALAGALGWLTIESAEAARTEVEGADYSTRGFVQGLIGQGAVPLPLVLRYGHGEPLWERARDRLLDG